MQLPTQWTLWAMTAILSISQAVDVTLIQEPGTHTLFHAIGRPHRFPSDSTPAGSPANDFTILAEYANSFMQAMHNTVVGQQQQWFTTKYPSSKPMTARQLKNSIARKRPHMVSALVMVRKAEPEASEIIMSSSLRGVDGGGYKFTPPLHPALLDTFEECMRMAKLAAANKDPTIDLTADEERFVHMNDAACAEVMALNRWLSANPQLVGDRTTKAQLKELFTSPEFKGKKRIVALSRGNGATNDPKVVNPCNVPAKDEKKGVKAADEKPILNWGCQTWLYAIGFEPCEIGWAVGEAPEGAVGVPAPANTVRKRAAASLRLRSRGEPKTPKVKNAAAATKPKAKANANSGAAPNSKEPKKGSTSSLKINNTGTPKGTKIPIKGLKLTDMKAVLSGLRIVLSCAMKLPAASGGQGQKSKPAAAGTTANKQAVVAPAKKPASKPKGSKAKPGQGTS